MKYQHFLNLVTEIFSKHVPMKKIYLSANQERFMTKDLRKAIMNHSILNFFSNKKETSWKDKKNNEIFVVTFCERPKKTISQTYIFCYRQQKFLANYETSFLKQSKILYNSKFS